jgi:hypothetical protein
VAASPPEPSLAPAEGQPRAVCGVCAVECGVVRAGEGDSAHEFLVDLEPCASQDADLPTLVWVEMFSGHPPVGRVLPMGALHRVHRCRGS